MAHSLADKLFNIKEKLTDQEYKDLMEDVGKLNKEKSFQRNLYKVTIMEVTGTYEYPYCKDDDEEEEVLYTRQLDCKVKFYNSLEVLHPSIVENVNRRKEFGRFETWSISGDNTYRYITKAELATDKDLI